MHAHVNPGILQALIAAALFGLSTPFAKLLLVDAMSPVLLAGLLYFGSGLGLGLWFLWRRSALKEAVLSRRDAPNLAVATVAGGVLGPLLLMWGLAQTSAATASLLLNLEGVFTTLFAWFLFKENFDRRIALGVAAITGGGLLLSWSGAPGMHTAWGPLAVAAACLCWGVDNNWTRKIAAADPVQIGAIKGLVAGAINLVLAFFVGAKWPGAAAMLSAGMLGFVGYGLSLALFIFALRHVGAARTSAYFSAAPFIGALASLLLLREAAPPLFWPAFALMAAGLWLHITELHAHLHLHEPLAHTHRHNHDAHHQHSHDFAWDGREPHTHFHTLDTDAHSHPHYPDIHHRHKH